MEKALLQYLRSLSQSGIDNLPRGGAEIARQLDKSKAATQEHIAADSMPVQMLTDGSDVNRGEELAIATSQAPPVKAVANTTPPAETVPASQESNSTNKVERLNVLSEKVKNCFSCSELVSNRTQTVFGVGDPEARLCFMGEAPGADEDVQGEPFVGAAGQLLDRIIAACKMKREDVYILNTLKCRLPNNRNPSEEECAQCRPFLDEQLEIIQPEYICCLGGIAAKHLLESPLSVGRLRGKVHLYNGIKVVVTYHPAYLLRNPDAKRQVWDDMKFLMSEMGHDIS